MNESNIEEVLKYSPCMLLIAKEVAYEREHQTDNRQFYYSNYNKLYYETDAYYQSLKESENIIEILVAKYLTKVRNADKTVIRVLFETKKIIEKQIKEDIEIIRKKEISEDRLKGRIIEELYTKKPISLLI